MLCRSEFGVPSLFSFGRRSNRLREASESRKATNAALERCSSKTFVLQTSNPLASQLADGSVVSLGAFDLAHPSRYSRGELLTYRQLIVTVLQRLIVYFDCTTFLLPDQLPLKPSCEVGGLLQAQ